ncbi:MAG TPA: hypothetical protein PKG52_09685 [bacterium]|nr:hypothetical protein [bacterium]HPS30590.1 hypothetical protein [bacterium]
MPKILIEHQSLKTDPELMLWMENNLQKTITDKARSEKISITTDNASKTVTFSGRTVCGTVRIDSGLIRMEIEIPLLYRPFIPAIKTAISGVFKEL